MDDDAKPTGGDDSDAGPPPHETQDTRGEDTPSAAGPLQSLLDRGPPVYAVDLERRLSFANAGFRNFPASDPTAIPDELTDVFDRLDAGEPEVLTHHEYKIGGQVRRYRATHFKTAGNNGAPSGYGGVYTDVTREGNAEARYRDIVRSSSDWVWETDANLNVVDVSDRITEVLALPASALRGKYLFTLGEFEGEPNGAPARPDLAAELAPFRGRVFLMRDRTGRTRRVALSGVPVFDQNGKFTGYRGTGTDVTTHYETEQRAHRAQRELESSLREIRERNAQLDLALADARSAVKAKTEFLGKMSHELRTPLNAVIGFAEMSVQQVFGSMNDRYLEYFRDIRSAAHHLLHIINDILDAASVDSSEVTVTPKPIRLREIVEEARSLIAVPAEQGGIDIANVTVLDDWIVMADPDRARQIFVNLLGNAVKFTESDGRVGIDVRRNGEDDLDITVWDTGMGIPHDELDRIFDSFHQVGAELMRRSSEGTGLGLTISRQLAQLMGGDITVTSQVGQGSRFTVRLPIALQLTLELAEAGE